MKYLAQKIKIMNKLNRNEINENLKKLSTGWLIKDEFIRKEFIFENFIEAFSFMTSVALVSEKADHHPNWENVYNKVIVSLSTHDADGLTKKDFDLAIEMDKIYNRG